LLAITMAAAVLGAAGCTGARESGEEVASPPRTTVRVENRSPVAVTVYAVRSGGQRRRLGRVSTRSESTFELPPTLVSRHGLSLRFQVESVGRDRPPITRQILVYAGEQVELEVPSF
jgi:hypothetical protein